MVEVVVCEPINLRKIEQDIASDKGNETIKTKTYVLSDDYAFEYMRTHNDQLEEQIRVVLERRIIE